MLCAEWRMPHVLRTFQNRWESGGSKNPQTSVHKSGIDPGPHSGVGPGGVSKFAVRECLLKSASADVAFASASPRCPIEVTSNQINLMTGHDGTAREDELFGDARFFAKMLQMCKHNTVKCFWPLIAWRLKAARARTPDITQPCPLSAT